MTQPLWQKCKQILITGKKKKKEIRKKKFPTWLRSEFQESFEWQEFEKNGLAFLHCVVRGNFKDAETFQTMYWDLIWGYKPQGGSLEQEDFRGVRGGGTWIWRCCACSSSAPWFKKFPLALVSGLWDTSLSLQLGNSFLTGLCFHPWFSPI